MLDIYFELSNKIDKHTICPFTVSLNLFSSMNLQIGDKWSSFVFGSICTSIYKHNSPVALYFPSGDGQTPECIVKGEI